MSQHVIVVGAGPGGLASALRLAGQGYTVTLFEAADRPGGRMRGLSLGPYQFDSGPTILQLPQLYADLFAAVGKRLEDYVTLKRLHPNTRLRFWDDSTLDLSSDFGELKRQLAALRPDLPAAFERWYIEHIRKDVVGYGPYISEPAREPLEYLVPREIAAALAFRPWETLYDHFNNYFHDDRLTYALAYPSKYLGMHPTRCSSIFSLIAFLELAYGVWHPMGGMRALAAGMARAFQDLGGELHLNSPVRQLWIEQGRARGVELANGTRVPADAVVVNADFGYAISHLLPPEASGEWNVQRVNRMRYSCSTFMLYLGLDRRYADLPHHQIYLSDHVRRRNRPFVDDSALDEIDPPFYVCNPSIVDPHNAPEGHSTLYVLVPIPNTTHHVEWSQQQQRSFRDLTVRRLAMLGFEDLERHIRAETCYTAETWRDDYHVHHGAVFNMIHSWSQIGPLRPPIRGATSGLYWVGGAVHPGSGLLTILEAAKNTARFVASDLPLHAPIGAA